MTQYYIFYSQLTKTVITTDDRNDVTNCLVNQKYITESISHGIKVSLNASDHTHQKFQVILVFSTHDTHNNLQIVN